MGSNLVKYITKRGKDIPYLYIDEKGVFYVRKRIGDATPRISLETDVESIAISKIMDAIVELEHRAQNNLLKPKKGQVLLFKDYFNKMVELKKSDEIKQSTLNRINIIYKYSLEPFFGNLSPNEINKSLEIEFMNWHRLNRKGIQFVNVFKYLNNVLRFMVENGAILPVNMPVFKVPRNEQKHHLTQKGTFIKNSEFKLIRAQFSPEYKLLLNLAYELGMRQMELGALECERVVKADKMVHIDLSSFDTKTGLARIVPVPDEYHDEILRLKEKNKRYIFESLKDSSKHVTGKHIFSLWKSAKLKAGITRPIRFHDLRHTRATILVQNNNNPILIATFLGMSIKTLQQKYLKLKPEDLLILLKNKLNLNGGDEDEIQP